MRRRLGFTLIELLVVIATISIIAAILFPVFAKARENGRRAACSSNMKQIMLGLFQYAQDNDERLPMAFTHALGLPGAATDRIIWCQSLQPYIKSTRVFVCPSDPASDLPIGPLILHRRGLSDRSIAVTWRMSSSRRCLR